MNSLWNIVQLIFFNNWIFKKSVIRYRLNDNGHEVIWSYLVWRWKTE